MDKKILLTFIFSMFLLSFTSAVSPDYIAEYCSSVDIKETCTVDGFPCDDSYSCNITIINPNLEVVVRDGEMTRNFPIYNYTFSNTTILGDYTIHIYCTNTTLGGYDRDITLEITTTGREPEIKLSIFMLLVSLVAFILALYLKNYAVGFISGILFLITGIYLIVYGFGDVANMYTQAMAYVILAFGMFIMLVSGYEWMDSMS